MAMAYAVILATTEMFDGDRRGTVQAAQREADRKFETMAREALLTQVTRNPEPRIMTWAEMRNAFPHMHLDGLVGLYFTADIT